MATGRHFHTATLLPSGKLLVTGGLGLASVEVYDPATGTWSPTASLATERYEHTATLLPSGKVLVTGGLDFGVALASAEVYDPATGTWSLTAPLENARSNHTATLLSSGKVLVTGGRGVDGDLASAELYDPATGTWSPTAPLATARSNHTATLLPSGKVLVTGGNGPSSAPASAEVYDPATGTWSLTAPLATVRSNHTATLLPSGKVLVAGGYGISGGGYLASAEVYDPATGTWSLTAPLAAVRSDHTATLLPSGKVLVTGGLDFRSYLASAEVYDPATGTWSPTAPLVSAREEHTATLLPSGKVLVTGGFFVRVSLASAEVYDPAAGMWSSTTALTTARSDHTATLLPSGKVLVTGGQGVEGYLASAEVYDPAMGTWSSTEPLATARRWHTATLLPSGKVLVTGGLGFDGTLASAELYDPPMRTWSPTAPLATARRWHTATLLPSGKVLVTGGYKPNGGDLASAEVYDPATETWSPTAPLATARSNHTATLLPSGKVLVTGGSSGFSGYVASAEVYDPATGTWSSTAPLATARIDHTATLLSSGKVMVIGGEDPSRRSSGVEVYDPATGTWSSTSPLGTARTDQTATLLPSGKVLVTGGYGPGMGVLNSAELYDPATGVWSPTVPLATARRWHTATLLPSGEILVTGGDGPSNLASAEVYEDTGALREWRPVISPLAQQQPDDVFPLTGSRLRGFSEASSGNTQSSATNLPMVSFLPVEGGKLTYATSLNSSSQTEMSVRTPRVPKGYYILSVMANAIHGGQLVLVDGPHPSTPTVTSPEAFVNTSKPVIGGTTQPGNTVTVWLDGAVAKTTLADAQGQWSFTPELELAEGHHGAVAAATDTAGNVSLKSEERSFIVDTSSPRAPTVIEPGAFVKIQKPVMGGTAEPGSTVTVSLDDDMVPGGTVKVDAAGNWSFTPSTALPEGLHQVRSTAQDKAGNVSPVSATHSFTVDTVPPEAPAVNSPGGLVNTSVLAIGGTAEPSSTVVVRLDETVTATTQADAQGNWSFAPIDELAEGPHRVVAIAIDLASNVSPDSEEYGFTVDTTPPEAPVVISPGTSVDTRTPIIRGTVEPVHTVKVWLGDDETTAEMVSVDAAGDWRFIPSTPLDFGNYTVSAIAMDAAGNRSAPAQRQFSIQRSHYGWNCTTAPALPATWGLLALAGFLRRMRQRQRGARFGSEGTLSS